MIDLSGRVAMVTGAASGLGRAHAELLATCGAKIIVNDDSPAGCQSVAAAIQRAGGAAMAAPGSVADYNAITRIVEDAHWRWGSIDILVNDKALSHDRGLAQMDLEDFRVVLEVDVMGAVHCAKAVWRHMQAARYGRIVMTTSSLGRSDRFGGSNHSAAKMALVGLMETLGIEGQDHDIRVNCLAPPFSADVPAEGPTADQMKRRGRAQGCLDLLPLVSEHAPTRTILAAREPAPEAACA